MTLPTLSSQALLTSCRQASETCTECGACVRECAFLKKHGTPKAIADRISGDPNQTALAFECSLCRLCTAVCPVKLDPADFLLAARRFAVTAGQGDFRQHKSLIAFETCGTSSFLSLYRLPTGCTTVLFPGCALAGSRSGRVVELFDWLTQWIPSLGIVLDCCTKPSHDLGRQEKFALMFTEMIGYLKDNGIHRVLVACPSCHQIFKRYGEGLTVTSVYEELLQHKLPEQSLKAVAATIHDPCASRFETGIHQAVRDLAQACGLNVHEMKRHGKKTLCCGEGAAACHLVPEIAGTWTRSRQEQAGAQPMISYCAGCTGFLGTNGHAAHHLLDLVFSPTRTMTDTVRVTKSPFTYFQRWRLKRHFMKNMAGANGRERTCKG